jgi:hypothetical protein
VGILECERALQAVRTRTGERMDITVLAFKGRLVDVGLDGEGNIMISVRRRNKTENIIRSMQKLKGREYVFKLLMEV